MARTLTPKDGRTLMVELYKLAIGKGITVLNTSDFVSAGETVLRTGMENVYNSLNMLCCNMVIAGRAYTQKVKLMQTSDDLYNSRFRKISYYSKLPKNAGNFNTDLFTNFATGFTAGQNIDSGTARSTKSQWEQSLAIPLELNFAGSTVWQDCSTEIEDAVKQAFKNEGELIAFVRGYLQEHQNDIVQNIEDFNRMARLNKVASVYAMSDKMPSSVVNLTAAFNAYFGTTYTSAQLRSPQLFQQFLAFFVSEFKYHSERMTRRAIDYHWSPAKNDETGEDIYILRHTSYDNQRAYLYGDLFRRAESLVLPEIFHDDALRLENYEKVDFWQSEKAGEEMKIDVIPAITDEQTGLQVAGDRVTLDYVVGMITDRDGLMTNVQLQRSDTTALEARKHFRNTWNSFARNVISDNTENCVIFIMKDEETQEG